MVIRNDGIDVANNMLIDVLTPIINANGNPTKLVFTDITSTPSAGIDFNNLNNSPLNTTNPPRVTLNAGNLAYGDEITITVKYLVPQGVPDGELIYFDAKIFAADDYNCKDIGTTLSFQTLVQGIPILNIRKSRTEAIIGTADPGEEIHYKIDVSNPSITPSTRSYMIDHLPNQTVLNRIYTSQTINGFY
ncbi:MAG: hypothetical protein H6546_07000 [Chitinophagales bacterium]|nr:hypothetical protein [Chitinophagales bacterium]